MSNLVKSQESLQILQNLVEEGKILTQGNLLPKWCDTPEKFALGVKFCEEINMPPITFMSCIYMVGGNISIMARGYVAMIRKAGHRFVLIADYAPIKNAEGKVVNNETIIHAWRKEDPETKHVIRYTKAEADTAGFTTGPNGPTWAKFPKDMLRAKCISRMFKIVYADLAGGHVYEPDEVGVRITNEDDLIVDSSDLEFAEVEEVE